MKPNLAYLQLKNDIEILSLLIQCKGSQNIFGIKTVKRGSVSYQQAYNELGHNVPMPEAMKQTMKVGRNNPLGITKETLSYLEDMKELNADIMIKQSLADPKIREEVGLGENGQWTQVISVLNQNLESNPSFKAQFQEFQMEAVQELKTHYKGIPEIEKIIPNQLPQTGPYTEFLEYFVMKDKVLDQIFLNEQQKQKKADHEHYDRRRKEVLGGMAKNTITLGSMILLAMGMEAALGIALTGTAASITELLTNATIGETMVIPISKKITNEMNIENPAGKTLATSLVGFLVGKNIKKFIKPMLSSTANISPKQKNIQEIGDQLADAIISNTKQLAKGLPKGQIFKNVKGDTKEILNQEISDIREMQEEIKIKKEMQKLTN
jgi:hypothetical protein